MAMTKKPTPSQRRALENMAAGLPANAHCRSRSDHGGFSHTIVSLHKAGWMNSSGITDAGRAALAAQAAAKGEHGHG